MRRNVGESFYSNLIKSYTASMDKLEIRDNALEIPHIQLLTKKPARREEAPLLEPDVEMRPRKDQRDMTLRDIQLHRDDE